MKLIAFTLGLVLMFQAGAGAQISTTKEFNELKAKADKHDTDAQYKVGYYYAVGIDGAKNTHIVPQSFAKALTYFKMAADSDNAEAAYKVGYLYEKAERTLNTKAVPRDLGLARKYYTKAAEKGLADAQLALAELLLVVKKEDSRADVNALDSERGKWLQSAALQGLAVAQRELGFCFYNGYGFDKDFVQAYIWTKLAALQGDKTALDRLDLIQPGPGKTRTLTMAQKPAAEQELARISQVIADAQKKLARSTP